MSAVKDGKLLALGQIAVVKTCTGLTDTEMAKESHRVSELLRPLIDAAAEGIQTLLGPDYVVRVMV